MAQSNKKAAALPLPKKVLTQEQIERGIARLAERVDELQTFDISRVPKGHSAELTALSVSIHDTLDRCFGEGTSAYQLFSTAETIQFTAMAVSDNYPRLEHYRDGAQRYIERAIALLKQAQATLREDLADVAHAVPLEAAKQRNRTSPSNKVFVVHGHDEAARESLARFLEKLELEAIILHEQPDQGRTIIEKFEEYAGQVGFAVVLLTPDDAGSAKGATGQNPRARQNVVFELGYFAGKLGRGKTCLMRKGDVEIPSDLYGVIYTELDASDGWKFKLGKELKAAGLTFDANKVWS